MSELPFPFRVKGHQKIGRFHGPGEDFCTCGARSGHMPSDYARRAWHYEHKKAVLQEQGRGSTDDGSPEGGGG